MIDVFKQLFYGEVTLYNEAFIESDDVGNPGNDKQVISDSDFNSLSFVEQHQYIQNGRIQDDVSVIRDIEMAFVAFGVLPVGAVNLRLGNIEQFQQDGTSDHS